MAKPNYAFAKRQRDLAKKQKKEEKQHRKTGTNDAAPEEGQPQEGQAQEGESPAPSSDDTPAA